MSTPRGYSSQEKDDRLKSEFATVEPVRTLQNGLSVLAHQFTKEVGTDAVEAGSSTSAIVATAHAALKGDIILFTSGALSGQEVKVWDVSPNVITIAETLSVAPATLDAFSILRHKYPVVDSSGQVKVVGVFSEVATAADGGALPAVVKVVGGYDGAAVQAIKTDAAGELQVDVLSSALPSGAATSATQTDGSQKTQIVDNSGNVIGSTGNALDVNLKSPITVDVSLSQANDSVAVFGSDGAVNRALKTDANGELQIDVLSSALPTGAATETTLSAIKTSVEILDNAIAGNEMQVDVKSIEGLIDTTNGSTTPLGISGNFTGAWIQITNYASIHVGVFADQNSATNGLKIQFSEDAVSVHHTHEFTFLASSNGSGYLFQPEFKYFRVNYTNGLVAQTNFNLISTLRSVMIPQSLYPASYTFTGQSQVILTKGIIVGETTGGGGGYVPVKVNPSGALTVESTLSAIDAAVLGQEPMATSVPVVIASNQTAIPVTDNGSSLTVDGTVAATQSGTWNINNVSGTISLPTGAATESTLNTLNGKVTACNTGAVTISTALPSGANTIGKVDVNTLSVVDLLDTGILDTSSTNIAGSASNPTQVVATLAAAVKKIQLLDTTGAFIGVYTGAALSEVLQFVMGPGSDQTIEHSISAGTRISLKRLDSTTAVSSGIVALNFIG